jgi:hypothetical protein
MAGRRRAAESGRRPGSAFPTVCGRGPRRQSGAVSRVDAVRRGAGGAEGVRGGPASRAAPPRRVRHRACRVPPRPAARNGIPGPGGASATGSAAGVEGGRPGGRRPEEAGSATAQPAPAVGRPPGKGYRVCVRGPPVGPAAGRAAPRAWRSAPAVRITQSGRPAPRRYRFRPGETPRRPRPRPDLPVAGRPPADTERGATFRHARPRKSPWRRPCRVRTPDSAPGVSHPFWIPPLAPGAGLRQPRGLPLSARHARGPVRVQRQSL